MTDDRNHAVLTAMESGRVYGRKQIDALFYKHTDVRRDSTIRQRLEMMVRTGELENVGIGKFRLPEGDI